MEAIYCSFTLFSPIQYSQRGGRPALWSGSNANAVCKFSLGLFEEKVETLKYNTLWNVEQQDSDQLKLLIGSYFKDDEQIEPGVWKFVGLIALVVYHRHT